MFTFVANPPNLANRGVHSYVNVAGSRLAGTVPDLLTQGRRLPFATVAGVSGECLPIYVLEGIYGRMVVLDPSLHGVAFGTVNLRPSVFLAVETALAATAFDWTSTTIAGFIRRLDMAVAQMPNVAATDESVIQTAGHPNTRPVDRTWCDGYKLEMLVDASQRLSVFANAGSKSHARYEAYRAAESVREYLQLGGRRADLQYDVDHGYVAYTST